ncbi:MAG: hypothetical protein QN189_09095 [Armatimonadota bacterium]|nr:hypothetical protein [Armatimonadota bacterium]
MAREAPLLIALPALALGLWAWSAWRIFSDARHRDVGTTRALAFALRYSLAPSRYRWGPGFDLRPPQEQRALLRAEAERMGLQDVTNIRCPLCETEIPHALTVDPHGRFDFPAHPIQCPSCDFRLDSCRFCQFFVPAKGWAEPDITQGTCQRYREWREVEEAYPHYASRLHDLGITKVHVPKRIVDSYIPLEECSGATLDPKRLSRGVPGLTRYRKQLIFLRQRVGVSAAHERGTPGKSL